MDVFNKLKNSVSSLTSVLPGNPVTREYEVGRHIGSAGPGLLWRVYQAIKRSTKQEAAVFVLEKKQLERYGRPQRDLLLESLKKSIAQLTRLRHPSILTVQHPMEESRESLAFATEPVFASLANVLGQQENVPVPPPPELKDFHLFDVEIKYGLFQICEGLKFLHHDVKLLHRNISPESIIVNKNGAWKIAGFDFCVPANSSSDSQMLSFPSLDLSDDLPPVMQPTLEYLAPEYVLTMTSNTSSDMFSLGALVYSVYNKGQTFYQCHGTISQVKQHCNTKLRQLSSSQLSCLPPDAVEHVKLMLNPTPELRPDSHQFLKLPFFEDVGVKTLQFLDSIYQLDNLQKSHFYKGLPQVLAQMPKRVSLHRILPCFVKEYVSAEMIPFLLPNVLLIAEQASKEEFCQYILPDLIPVFRLQEPIQILLIFMQKMELLLTKCPANDIRNHILPMIYSALEADAQQIQELCLNVIPSFANLIEYSSMKNSLIPRIKKISLNTNFLSVRVNSLVCLGKLLEHLDKWLVLDDILPMLPQIPSKEPAVLMGILGIYKLTMEHKKLGITKDIMASQVIPFLMPLTIENGLTLNQFNALMAVVKEMVNRVEGEHRSKLEQLNSIRQGQRTTIEMTKMGGPDIIPHLADPTKKTSTDEMFNSLGLNDFTNNRPNFESNSFNSSNSSATNSMTRSESLTMEDKQRLAREQDFQQRMKTQMGNGNALLTPQTSLLAANQRPTSAPSGPRDLTSTLIQSNLSSLQINNQSSPSLQLGFQPSPNLQATSQGGLGLMTNQTGTAMHLGGSNPPMFPNMQIGNTGVASSGHQFASPGVASSGPQFASPGAANMFTQNTIPTGYTGSSPFQPCVQNLPFSPNPVFANASGWSTPRTRTHINSPKADAFDSIDWKLALPATKPAVQVVDNNWPISGTGLPQANSPVHGSNTSQPAQSTRTSIKDLEDFLG